jgi:hypothetical protein
MLTLSQMKNFLNISLVDTTFDTFLETQISVVSEAVEGYCNRKFSLRSYVEYFFREDFSETTYKIQARQFPIVSLQSLQVSDSEDSLTWEGIASYRLHKPSGIINSQEGLFRSGRVLKMTYSAGYAEIPAIISHVIYSIVEERYNKKVSGVSLNFGSDVQRISIPGSIAIDFDYSLNQNERKSAYGVILGNFLNVLDPFRSERVVSGPSKLSYLESL